MSAVDGQNALFSPFDIPAVFVCDDWIQGENALIEVTSVPACDSVLEMQSSRIEV